MMVVMTMLMGLGLQAQQPSRVPAYPGIIERTQPNGYVLRTYLRGDEHMHFMMTEDGWEIMENKKGWLVYAKKDKKGQTVPACRKAHNKDQRSRCEKCWLKRHGIVRAL